MSILNEIFAHKKIEVEQVKLRVPESDLETLLEHAPIPPNFQQALRDPSRPLPRLIAEVKQRSPSKGLLCEDFDPEELALTYAANGASAVSVLSDEKYFGGSLAYLQIVRKALDHSGYTNLPLLRKDFIFCRYQLLEARLAGASAVLLIAAMLTDQELTYLHETALKLDLTPLVEVHSKDELRRVLQIDPLVVGINNRDLNTFTVDLNTTLSLVNHIPKSVITVAESGISTIDDVAQLTAAKVDAMLIGESLVTAADRPAAVRRFSRMEKLEKAR